MQVMIGTPGKCSAAQRTFCGAAQLPSGRPVRIVGFKCFTASNSSCASGICGKRAVEILRIGKALPELAPRPCFASNAPYVHSQQPACAHVEIGEHADGIEEQSRLPNGDRSVPRREPLDQLMREIDQRVVPRAHDQDPVAGLRLRDERFADGGAFGNVRRRSRSRDSTCPASQSDPRMRSTVPPW